MRPFTSTHRRLPIAAALLLVASIAPTPAFGECLKRIVVYLDVSGTMDPTRAQGADSPYGKTIDALRDLTSNFFSDGDTLIVRPFGASVISQPIATSPADAGALLRGLDTHPKAIVTDLGPVFADIEELFSRESGVERTVVILASDLVQEAKPQAFSAKAAREEWQGIWDRHRNQLEEIFGKVSSGNDSLIVFLAPPARSREAASRLAFRSEVVQQIEAAKVASFHDLAGPSDSRALASSIRQRFERPLLLSPVLAAPDRLAIDLENPGCVPVKLRHLTVRCAGQSDLLKVPLDRATEFAPKGEEGYRRTISYPVDAGTCPSDRFEVVAASATGVLSSTQGTLATRLEYLPISATLMPPNNLLPVLGGVLEIKLKAWGAVKTNRHFKLLLRDPPDQVQKIGTIEIPESIAEESETAKVYRLAFDDPPAWLFEGRSIRVELEGANTPPEAAIIAVQHDAVTAFLANWLSLLSFIATAFIAWRGQKELEDHRHSEWIQIVAAGLLTFVLRYVFYFSGLDAFLATNIRNALMIAILGLFLLYVLLDSQERVNEGRRKKVIRGALPPSDDLARKYAAELSSGKGATERILVIGLATIIIGAILVGLIQPPDTVALTLPLER